MKLIGKIFISLIVLLALAIIALLVLVDPNSFKPRIESIAKEQGIALQMKGDLGWAFWPSIGVAINEVSIAADATPTQPIADFKQASLMLALKPLLAGKFEVDHVALDGANINLSLDKHGKGNWESLSKNNAPPAPTEESNDASTLQLSVEKISLTNASLVYVDEKTEQRLSVRDINLTMTHLNTHSEPFDVTLQWALEMTQPNTDTLMLQGELSNRIAMDEHFQQITLDQGSLHLILNKTTTAPIDIAYSVALKDPQNALSYQGEFQLQPVNAKQLLESLGTTLSTANKNALTAVSASGMFSGDQKKLALDDLKLQLDKTHVDGNLAITDFATSAIKVTLKGDGINADDYLAPKTETTEATPATEEDTPLPLDALRTLDLDAHIALNTLQINKMALSGIDLTVKAKQGIITQTLKATAYEGAISLNTKTDARSEKAQVNFDGGVSGLELKPLLDDMDMSEKMALTGAIQAKTQGTTQGASVNQLMESMNSTANFSGAQVRLSPLNIEEQFCKLVNLVTQSTTEEITWDSFTEMRQLDGNIIWQDQIIKLDNFSAGVSQLLLNSTGKINLATDKYEFKLPLKLAEASQAASLKGCSLSTTNYWVDRGLSLLRCKGKFAAIDPIKDCGFDKSALGDLTKDFAEYKLREKHGAKIEAAEQKVDEKKQELKQKVDDKKKDLFNKLQSKLLKPEKTSSAASTSSAANTAPAE